MRISDIYTSQTIAAYFSEAASNRIPFLGEAYFPNKKKMGIDLNWLKSHKGLGVALKPSNFDAIPTVRPRGKAEMTKEQMPLFRESMTIKETNLMELARIRDINDPFLPAVIDALYQDTRELIEGAEISAEKMRMALLAPVDGNAVITIGAADATSDETKYGYNYDSDGTWKSKHYMALNGTDKWDAPATAKPLNDLRTAQQSLSSVGTTATTIICNTATLDLLLENDQIKNAITVMSGTSVNFVDEGIVEEVIRRRLRMNVVVYDKMYQDFDGTDKKFYPDGYVTVLGSGQLGSTFRGTTPEELTTIGGFTEIDLPQAPVDITVLESGIAVAVQNEYKPSFTVTTTASQIVLPSFEGMDSIFVIKVA